MVCEIIRDSRASMSEDLKLILEYAHNDHPYYNIGKVGKHGSMLGSHEG